MNDRDRPPFVMTVLPPPPFFVLIPFPAPSMVERAVEEFQREARVLTAEKRRRAFRVIDAGGEHGHACSVSRR